LKKTFYQLLLPLAALLLLVLLAWLLNFNGLYGQDAHEYWRLSRVFHEAWQQGIPWAGVAATRDLAPGYPALAGAFSDGLWPLQALSLLACAGTLWYFDALLQVLSPGARAASRRSYALLLLLGAPWFLRAGLTVMSDALGLFFMAGACFYGFRLLEKYRVYDAPWMVLMAAAACCTRYSVAPLLAPLLLYVWVVLWRAGRWRVLLMWLGLLVLPVLWWYSGGLAGAVQGHSAWQGWSVWHWWRRSFEGMNGLQTYWAPNLIYGWLFPLIHPGFCVSLSLLFPLFRRTDVLLPSKRLALLCMALHGLFLAGFDSQNVRWLLPDYFLLLLIMFPAWDRFFAYGFYFLKNKWMLPIFGVLGCIQLFFIIKTIRPVLERHQQEQFISRQLRIQTPSNALIYTFDMDVALKNYLPDRRYRNLWAERMDTFEAGGYLLLHRRFTETQWAGRNPALNVATATEKYLLEPLDSFPDHWKLYRIRPQK
jgi:hypothetical protein